MASLASAPVFSNLLLNKMQDPGGRGTCPERAAQNIPPVIDIEIGNVTSLRNWWACAGKVSKLTLNLKGDVELKQIGDNHSGLWLEGSSTDLAVVGKKTGGPARISRNSRTMFRVIGGMSRLTSHLRRSRPEAPKKTQSTSRRLASPRLATPQSKMHV